VAPVVFKNSSAIVEIFQAMDFMVLQGITGASVFRKIHAMCNGANLAYERNAFFDVGGFKGVDHIASGDDMLLMQKFAEKYPDRIYYLKSKPAIVSTSPMPTWRSFFNQRVRWASKATSYRDKQIFWVLLLVYVFNFSFLVMLFAGFWNQSYWLYFLLAIILKTLVELHFVLSISRFFNKQSIVKYFLFFQPLHIVYTIIAGFFGQFGSYEWKGRRVK
jgi:cellulose synthase/poly-beta-1,6-N-acetylglucosamine synthase-like glycosyltransferase